MTRDLLAPLQGLADVSEALDSARDAVDAAFRHPALRGVGATAGPGARIAAEAGLHTAVASAALEGCGYDLADVRAGTVTDPVVQGALRVSATRVGDARALFRPVSFGLGGAPGSDYGAGGAAGGSNIAISIPSETRSVTFVWDQVTHVVTHTLNN